LYVGLYSKKSICKNTEFFITTIVWFNYRAHPTNSRCPQQKSCGLLWRGTVWIDQCVCFLCLKAQVKNALKNYNLGTMDTKCYIIVIVLTLV